MAKSQDIKKIDVRGVSIEVPQSTIESIARNSSTGSELVEKMYMKGYLDEPLDGSIKGLPPELKFLEEAYNKGLDEGAEARKYIAETLEKRAEKTNTAHLKKNGYSTFLNLLKFTTFLRTMGARDGINYTRQHLHSHYGPLPPNPNPPFGMDNWSLQEQEKYFKKYSERDITDVLDASSAVELLKGSKGLPDKELFWRAVEECTYIGIPYFVGRPNRAHLLLSLVEDKEDLSNEVRRIFDETINGDFSLPRVDSRPEAGCFQRIPIEPYFKQHKIRYALMITSSLKEHAQPILDNYIMYISRNVDRLSIIRTAILLDEPELIDRAKPKTLFPQLTSSLDKYLKKNVYKKKN